MKLTVTFETHDNEAGWIAKINEMPGMIEQGETKSEAWQQLMIGLQVKIAHDSGIEANSIQLLTKAK